MRFQYFRPCLAAVGLCSLLMPSFAHAKFSAGAQVKKEVRRLVLAVGINDFRHARDQQGAVDHGWAPLRFAAKDAQNVVDELAPYGFEIFGGAILTGTSATYSGIRDRLDRLVEETKKNPEHTYEVILYFSSHGFSLRGPDGDHSYIVAHDTPPQSRFLKRKTVDSWRRAGHFALDREAILTDFIEHLDNHVRRVAVIYDACYVAGGKGPLEAKGSQLSSRQRYKSQIQEQSALERARHSTLVFSSVSTGQVAVEDANIKGSRYTHYLTQALRQGVGGAADNLIPAFPFSLFEAHQWATLQVRNLSGDWQIPSWGGPRVNEGSGFFYLEPNTKDPKNHAAVLVQEPRPLGTQIYMMLTGAKGVPQEVEIPTSGMTVPRPGTYRVRVRNSDDGSLALTTDVKTSAGQVVVLNVAQSMQRRPHHIISAGGGYLNGNRVWGSRSIIPPNGPLASIRYGLDGWPAPGWVMGVGVEGNQSSGTSQNPQTCDTPEPTQSGCVEANYDQSYFGGTIDVDRLLDVGRVRLGAGASLVFGGQHVQIQNANSNTYFLPGVEARLSAQFGLTRWLSLDVRGFGRLQGYGMQFEDAAAVFGGNLGLIYRMPSTLAID